MSYEFRNQTVHEAINSSLRPYRLKFLRRDVLIDRKSIFSIWAPPLSWGPWSEIFAVFGVVGEGGNDAQIRKTISYQTTSQAKSTFDVEVKGADRFVSAVGPGSSDVTITGNVATAISIRARSHSVGQQVRVSVR
ncbi:MAG: colicin Z C-terminal domain-related protein [Hyphomicrobiales bacterium]